ncbi:MAG: hypothetical protein KBS72_03740 [Bacteroidales bacterium]|nr:hypothetical protein [Candidatus Cacconaster scatequi]
MNKRTDEIRDDELRVIGQSSKSNSCSKLLKKYWFVAVLAIILVIATIIILPHTSHNESVQEVFDPSASLVPCEEVSEPIQLLGDYSDTSGVAYTEHLQHTINDIPLDIYIPHNAVASLSIGTPDIKDKSIIFVTQAADIRADNGKINGAFVLAGEPMAWGLSKKGFVSIIDNKIIVGVADNSPLFEEATEKGGYFFRQYALVNNGVLVENEPKNKSIRKAICDRGGEIIIVMSQNPESFHDFAQALVDFRVDNAVYLVGSDSYGFYRDKYDHFVQICEKRRGGYKYENYIEWKVSR